MTAQTVAQRLLRALSARLAPESRQWGEAIAAEMEFAGGSLDTVSWALGGAIVMVRMLARQWLGSSVLWFSPGPAEGATRPPRRWRGPVFVLLAAAMLLSPDFRQALEVVRKSLQPEERLFRSGNLDEIAARAERERNAAVLAEAALQSRGNPQRGQWADKAVAIDPSLTWIYYALLADANQEVRARMPNAGPPLPPLLVLPKPAGFDDTLRRLAALRTWDPDNAVPSLLEAELRFPGGSAPPRSYGGPQSLRLFEQLPEWRAAMHAAFTAPRYDSYVPRRFALARQTAGAFGGPDPLRLFAVVASARIPNLMQIRHYANWLVGEAAFRARRVRPGQPPVLRGPADPQRIPQYWEAALFGERMQAESSTDIEQRIGVAVETTAYPPLQQALQQTGRAQEAAAIRYRLQQLDRTAGERRAAWDDPGRRTQVEVMRWLALGVTAAAALALLCLVALLLAGLYRLERRLRPGGAVSWFDRASRAVFAYAPAALFGACLALYLCYRPYAQALRRYMSITDVRVFHGIADVLAAFWSTPAHLLLQSTYRAERAYYGSWVLLVVMLALLAWRLERMFHRGSFANS